MSYSQQEFVEEDLFSLLFFYMNSFLRNLLLRELHLLSNSLHTIYFDLAFEIVLIFCITVSIFVTLFFIFVVQLFVCIVRINCM